MKQCVCSCYSFYDLRKPEKQVERGKYFLCRSWKVAEPFVYCSCVFLFQRTFGDLIFHGHKDNSLCLIRLRGALVMGAGVSEVPIFVM